MSRKDGKALSSLIATYLDALRVQNYSPQSVAYRRYCLRYFTEWAAERSIATAADVTLSVLRRYQASLFNHRKKDSKPLAPGTQYGRLAMVGAFCRWLAKSGHVPANPAADLDLPHLERRLPRAVLSPEEVERVLGLPDVRDPLGLRDRAIMEVLYSTGIRRKELCGLGVTDLDAERGTILVRLGKCQKDRLLPIGQRALAWLDRYLVEARPRLADDPDSGVLFLNRRGQGLGHGYVGGMVHRYIDAAALGKRGSCHLLRHSMATAMLEDGADVRFIQAMLGHDQLSSTQLYTRVAIGKLKEVHAATHPGARLRDEHLRRQ